MNLTRLFKHLITTHWSVGKYFSSESLAAIKLAIDSAELSHNGEIRFAVEAALPPSKILSGMTARERALDVFSELRVWDTEQNSGVLIYFLLADHAIEIIADRGIHVKTESSKTWQNIVTLMQDSFSMGRFKDGAINGVVAVAEELRKYFPSVEANTNELPNEVVLL